jgi:hypothetical protein
MRNLYARCVLWLIQPAIDLREKAISASLSESLKRLQSVPPSPTPHKSLSPPPKRSPEMRKPSKPVAPKAALATIRLDANGLVAGLVMLPSTPRQVRATPGSFLERLTLVLGRLMRLRGPLPPHPELPLRTGKQPGQEGGGQW